jgi:hypothetical protein
MPGARAWPVAVAAAHGSTFPMSLHDLPRDSTFDNKTGLVPAGRGVCVRYICKIEGRDAGGLLLLLFPGVWSQVFLYYGAQVCLTSGWKESNGRLF